MFRKLFLSFWLSLTPALALGDMHEIKSLREILKFVVPQTFIVFDIDNTLAHPPQDLGSDQSWKWMQSQYRAQGLSEEEAIKRALLLWGETQYFTDLIPVEALTPQLIAYLQKSGLKVMALTARSSSLAKRTVEQLKRIGIDFSGSSLLQTSQTLFVEGQSVVHHQGVLFATGLDKGKILRHVLQGAGQIPRSVVFVDDKKHHLEELEKHLSPLGGERHLFRYGAADVRVQSFRSDLARIQLSYMKRLLSNRDAEKLRDVR